MKKLSNYTLEEQLACINRCLSEMQSFGHVFEDNDKTTKHLLSRQTAIINELERRENEEWQWIEDKLNKTIVYDNGGETLDRYTVFTPDGAVYGMSETGGGFNQYIGDSKEVKKGKHLGVLLKSVPDGIKQSVLNRITQ